MKKRDVLLTCLLTMFLVSCNGNTMNQTEAAKILLANERLDENSLGQNGNLFTSGKQVFNRIKEATRKYSQNNKKERVKSAFHKDGTTYTWSGSHDYSNFLSAFNASAKGIESDAKAGSDLIDSTKKNVRVVNKWVEVAGEEILLVVDENSETIFSRHGNQYEICRRYQNELGQNVFETFVENYDTDYKGRMAYIPGLRYEHSSIQLGSMSVIIADKEKGYWDVMSTSFILDEVIPNYYFTNLVIKDDITYETGFYIDEYYSEYNGVKMIDSSTQSDLFHLNNSNLTLMSTGLVGLDSFYIVAEDDEVFDVYNNDIIPDDPESYKVYVTGDESNRQYFTQDRSLAIAKFESGKEMKKDDTFYDGAVTMQGTTVAPIGSVDFYGSIILNFTSNDIDFIFENLEKLAQDFDFSFKGEYENIKESTIYALNDRYNFSSYYKWHGLSIDNIDDIKTGITKEEELITNFIKLYEGYKDVEVIHKNEQAKLDKAYHFADISLTSLSQISNNDFAINIEDLEIKVDDTILFVQDEEYTVGIAIANEENGTYSNILPLDMNGFYTATYNGEKSFTLKQTCDFTIPLLEEGEYVLVAYIATLDEKIRVTKPCSIEGSINEAYISKEGLVNRLYSEENIIKIKATKDSTINLSLEGDYNYEELFKLLESYAYNHGMVLETNLEKENESNWEVVENDELITSGTYRLKYMNNDVESYVVAVIK